MWISARTVRICGDRDGDKNIPPWRQSKMESEIFWGQNRERKSFLGLFLAPVDISIGFIIVLYRSYLVTILPVSNIKKVSKFRRIWPFHDTHGPLVHLHYGFNI
jgi:hypothetical protein